MQCLVCKTEMPERKNKRFCSDACRVEYHNARTAEYNAIKRKVNNILAKNRKILKSLHDLGRTTVSEKELMVHHYNFGFFTSQFINSELRTYYYCYDFGFCKVGDDKYLVVKNIRKIV